MNIPMEAAATLMRIANNAGLHGKVIVRALWVPPQSATSDANGSWAVEERPEYESASIRNFV